jgi:hypothetical protein
MEQQRPRLNNLAITYHNESLMDGAGSQLCRIYGIYALAREWNIFYYHSPLKRIGYQGILALEKNEENLALPKRYNEIFCLPSDLESPPDAEIIDLPLANQQTLACIREAAEKNPKRFFLVRIAAAMTILRNRLMMLEAVRALTPFKKQNSSVLRVAVHVRWGDLPIGYTKRLLPNQYYIDVVTKIGEMLEKRNIPYVCELHTELSAKPMVVTPNHYGVEGRLKEPMVLDPEIFRIREFEGISNLKKFINEDPIQTLEQLATSDILIMSRSAFSYLAAMLNQTGAAVYVPFEYPLMPGWLLAQPVTLFEKNLEEFCEQWIGT